MKNLFLLILFCTFSIILKAQGPIVTSEVTATLCAGTPFSYNITATGTPTSYDANPLPAGLTIDQSTGIISGTPTIAGNYHITVIAYNSGGEGSAVLILSVTSAPVITGPITATSTLNVPFSDELIASINSSTTYSATGLPTGLTINNITGLISGAPTESGTFNIILSGTDVCGTGTLPLILTVVGMPVISNLGGQEMGADVGIPFNVIVEASNNPTNYSAIGLPPGLYINALTGDIYGTPTTSGTFMPTVSATNAVGTATVQFTINVNSMITSATKSAVCTGGSFNYTITTLVPFTSATASPLPAGLSIDPSTGIISGSVNTPGLYTINLGVSSSVYNFSASQVLTLTVNPAPAITSALIASGNQATPFTYQIIASNIPISYAATGLPSGLSINTTTGLISGTPTESGTFNITLIGTNICGTGTQTLVLTIPAPIITITSPTSASACASQPFSYAITTSSPATSYTATSLPAGLTLDRVTGIISGSISATGTYTATINVSNSTYDAAQSVIFTVTAAPVITSAISTSGVQNFAFLYQIIASNNPTSYTATTLPAGLSINTSTGLISGVPTVGGVFNTTVTATNICGIATQVVKLNITGVPVITSSSTPLAFCPNIPVNLAISATNSPTSYNSSGLPTGLTINSLTGIITGTPTIAGNYNVVLNAINAVGTGSLALSITISHVQTVLISGNTSCLSVYGSTTLTASPAGNYTWTTTSGRITRTFSNNVINYSTAGIPAVITAKYSALGGCTGSASVNTISTPPAPTIGKSPACILNAIGSIVNVQISNYPGSGTYTLKYYSVLSNGVNFLAEGQYTPSATGVISIPLSSIVTSTTGGSAVYQLFYNTAASCTSTQAAEFSISMAPQVVTISGNISCLSPAGYSILTASPAGNYNWTFTSGRINKNTSSDQITYFTSGTAASITATYTTQFGGCSVAGTVNTTVIPPAPIVTEPSCVVNEIGSKADIHVTNYPGSGTYTLKYTTILPNGVNFLAEGTYIPSVTGDILVPLSSTVTAATGGSAVYDLTYNSTECSGITPNYVLLEMAPQFLSINGNTPLTSVGTNTILTATPCNSCSYNWSTLGGTVSEPTGNPVTYTTNGKLDVVKATYVGQYEKCSISATVNIVPAIPVITSPLTVTGIVGTLFNYQIAATSGLYVFSSTTLPAGLIINTSTGIISGVPTAKGTYTVTITATNVSGEDTKTLTIIISCPTNLAISGPSNICIHDIGAFTVNTLSSNVTWLVTYSPDLELNTFLNYLNNIISISPLTGPTTEVLSVGQPGVIRLTATVNACNQTTLTKDVVIGSPPSVISYSASGRDFTFTAAPIPGDIDYIWYIINDNNNNLVTAQVGGSVFKYAVSYSGESTVYCLTLNACGISSFNANPNGTAFSSRPALDDDDSVDSQPINYVISPNPAKNEITISAKSFEEAETSFTVKMVADNGISIDPFVENIGFTSITIYNVLGQIQKYQSYEQPLQQATIDVSSLVNGLYFVKINSGVSTEKQELIIQK